MTDCLQATAADLPELTALWHDCFDDEPEQISAFWRTLFAKIQVYALRRDGQLAAMVCALPTVFLSEDGGESPTAYLYAACTAPRWRGKGLFRTLTAFAEEALRQGGVAYTALVPANAPLFAFYEKLGYAAICRHNTETLPAAASALRVSRLDAQGYRNLRQLQLYGDFLDYGTAFLTWQALSCEHSGAGLFRLETQELVCCAAAVRRGDTLLCQELLPNCPAAATALAAQLGCKQVCVRTVGKDAIFGMMKALSGQTLPKNAYLGLAFD